MSCKPRDAPEPDADSSTLGAMAELLAAARASGCEALLENFTAAFIAAVSSGFPGESPCARAAAALDKLKKIATAHAECAAMEALMDKAYFRELVVERDYFSYGGLDKQGRNILWVRSDKVQKGMWALKPNSPRALAYVRAHIFSFQALCAMGTENSIYSVAIYFDMTTRGCLDFNIAVMTQSLRLVGILFPVPCQLVFIGLGKTVTTIWDLISHVMDERMKSCSLLIDRDDYKSVADFPLDLSRIPDWFLDDGTGRQYDPHDRRNVWCWERCLSPDSPITLKDVYNAGPWPYDEVAVAASGPVEAAGLEALPEGDEDGEGW